MCSLSACTAAFLARPWQRVGSKPGTSRAFASSIGGRVGAFLRIAQDESPTIDAKTKSRDLAQASTTLASQLATEWSSFKSADIAQVVSASARVQHRHPPLLEAAATHVLRGMFAYPMFALCNILNSFARLDYHNRQLMDAVALHIAKPDSCSQLSPVDIASLVFAYAHLLHRAGSLLESCAQQVQKQYHEVTGPNIATILNSYARLGECNPELFRVLSRSLVQTRPESFEPYHLSLIMNSMARCNIRKSQTLHLIASYLHGRVHLLGPQNVANVIHACAKLDCYDHTLFASLHERLLREDLTLYKKYELANVVHGLAKLKSGGPKLYTALFAECLRRENWEPRSVAQVLDAMRRKHEHVEEPLILLFMRLFLERLGDYTVHQLTQATWCLVELDALELAAKMPSDLLPTTGAGETPAMCVVRLALERMEELSSKVALTPTQRLYVQQLVRAYHYKHELDYGLQPHHVRAFCRVVFDVPISVTTSAARPHKRRPAQF